jgi:hypothetical protein
MKMDSMVNRRTFLKGTAIFGGFAALLGIARPAGSKPAQPPPQTVRPSQGYRLTEHIRKYYQTARL